MKDLKLIWESHGEDYFACTPFDNYYAYRCADDGVIKVSYGGEVIRKECESYDEAKQFAKADFKQRVLKCCGL